MRRESWCWEAPLTMMMMSVSLAVAMDPGNRFEEQIYCMKEQDDMDNE